MIKILTARAMARPALFIALLLAVAFGNARAADYLSLPVVKPVQDCAQLAQADLDAAAGAKVTIQSAALISTAKGNFCKILGNIAPSIGFEVDLPAEHWTQRFIQGGCGGLCGMRAAGISNASGCAPALNGEFAVAGDDMGHESPMGAAGTLKEAAFAEDPQKRIDFAYRGNHVTTLVAKALIKDFYGQEPRFSYFMGCSDGGREALMEAQRFPKDFDGISAGDPAAQFQIQDNFYHAWNALSDRRADGSYILMPDKRALLHQAVLAHCDTLSGVKDGLLEAPWSCDFDPATLRCTAGDTPQCLTDEELAVVRKQYAGAADDSGHSFTFGVLKGSEDQWTMADSPHGNSFSAGMAERSIAYVSLPQISLADADIGKFRFTEAQLDRLRPLAPLYDATNTDLKNFAGHGGKLILWHGLADTRITPGISIAYYQGVQKYMGVSETDRFMRLFLLAGVGHCGGGDGYDQIDLLSPLMAWTEVGRAPQYLTAGKRAGGGMMAGGPPPGAGRPAGGGAPPAGGGGPGPVAQAAPRYSATRPIFPYPAIAQYTGSGDPNDAANYRAVPAGTMNFPLNSEALTMIGPDNQKFYRVANGTLAITGNEP